MQNLKLFSGGKKSHQKELENQLKNKIDIINSANDKSDEEKQNKIASIKLKFKEEIYNLDNNLY